MKPTPHFFDKIKYFIIDMDGTFYLGDKLIDGSDRFIDAVLASGRDYRFFTNNSSHNTKACEDKLKSMNFDGSSKVVISSHVAIEYIGFNHPDAKIYLLGNENFTNDCINAGLNLTNDDPDIVLLGFDTTLNYEKISKAANFIADDSVKFFATHPDMNCPMPKGFLPDTGAMIEMFYASTGRRPDIIFGKPHKYAVTYIQRLLTCTRDEICFIGDRLQTDIAIGQYGVKTVLVYSGVTDRQTYEQSQIKADAEVDNLAQLIQYL